VIGLSGLPYPRILGDGVIEGNWMAGDGGSGIECFVI
jgi:hypothetical protein